jgi:transposase-like protein
LDDFEACIAHLQLPIAHRRATRTTNLLERLFGEERRRTKVIPHAFGERAVLKLMYAALIRASQGWRRLVISEFELRQLIQLREELNRRHDARHAPAVKRASHPKISSRNRT